MLKRFIYILIALAILLTALTSYLWYQRANLASYYLTHKLKLNSSINDIYFSSPSQIELHGLEIENLPNSNLPYAFITEKIVVKYNLKDLLKNPIIIEQIEIDNTYLGLEQYKDNKFNWEKIATILSKDNNTAEIKSGLGIPSRSFIIKALVFNNLSIEISSNTLGSSNSNLKQLEFNDIGNNGNTQKTLISAITKVLIDKIFDTLKIKNLLNVIIETPQGVLNSSPEKVLEGLNKSIKKVQESVEDKGPQIEKIFEDLGKLFKNLDTTNEEDSE